MESVVQLLLKENILSVSRNELYGAYGTNDPKGKLAFALERNASSLFGITQFGTHLTAYVPDQYGVPSQIWLAKRSAHKHPYPGRYDSTVGGGLPVNSSVMDNMIKEAGEEAGIVDPSILDRITPAGQLSYMNDEKMGLKWNTMVCLYILLWCLLYYIIV